MKDELISVEILAYIVLLDKRSHLKILQGNKEGYGMTPLLPSHFPYCTRKTEEESAVMMSVQARKQHR